MPPQPPDTGDIIIKGGSVRVTFGPDGFKQSLNDPKIHSHDDLTITRVLVKTDSGDVLYDSDISDKGTDVTKLEVRVSTGSK